MTAAIVKVWLTREGMLTAAAIDENDGRAAFLAQYLQSDIQTSSSHACEWLEWIAAVESGQTAQDEGNGNAFSFTIDDEGVELTHEYMADPPTYRYSFAELRQTMNQVLTVLQRNERGFAV